HQLSNPFRDGGTRIRNEFDLWHEGNRALLLDCQRIKFNNMPSASGGVLFIHPDEASAVIIEALWTRLRH
ncbi:MAG: hypothetical protein ACXWUA_21990, partial [Methylomagnum sp.]